MKMKFARTGASALFLCLLSAGNAAEGNPSAVSSAEELVAKHLDSLGDANARASVKTRVAEGTVHFQQLVGGPETWTARSALVSEGDRKFHFMMKFANNEYRGEQFITDGTTIEVTGLTAQFNRSTLGTFIFVQDAILREGLLGGVLSTAWPLLDVTRRQPKLSFAGLKKTDGRQLYDLGYVPRTRSDLDIHLYFEPETYHHVMTVYSLTVEPTIRREMANARQFENRTRLEERFDEFKTTDGLTLPTRYQIPFAEEVQNGRSTLVEWDIAEHAVANNISLDPRNFVVK